MPDDGQGQPARGGKGIWHLEDWPALDLGDLPGMVGGILQKVPRTQIGPDGYLTLVAREGWVIGRVPHARTNWNMERSQPGDRLRVNLPWGIVLHWYGEKENFDPTVKAYLRGFDSMRRVENYLARTSAHFLVGPEQPEYRAARPGDTISILQTQEPDTDGWPFLASHLAPLDYLANVQRKQYFVRALYQLGYQEPGLHSVLQDYYNKPHIDPNQCTIAIEICGYDFEHPAHFPTEQQIANVVSVVWATMKRYGIQAVNILGHHEIQLGKADPGKKFMALMRFLIGIKALVERDAEMMQLVFGQFLDASGGPAQAVSRYFRFVRDQLVLVGTQRQVYEWEATCHYWVSCARVANTQLGIASNFQTPFEELQLSRTLNFLHPENHEGVDLLIRGAKNRYNSIATTDVRLVADGTCLFTGEIDRCIPGQAAIFNHYQQDGAQILTVFGNLSSLGNLQAGKRYPGGYHVGAIESTRFRWNPSLHFAIAFGATWDTDLRAQPFIPFNAGTSWILSRYLDPLTYLERRLRQV